MSRTLSPRALKAFFSPDSDENVIMLLKIYGANLSEPIYLADGWTKRIDSLSTDDDVVYGVTSGGIDHIFLPFELPLPNDDEGRGPTTQLVVHNATGMITPQIRSLTSPPKVRLQIVLQGLSEAGTGTDVSSPEITIDNLELRGITYDADTVSGELVIESLAYEPFPQHTMTPSYCPGLF